MKSCNKVISTAIISAFLVSTPLMAVEQGDILVRARIINIAPDVGSNDITDMSGTSLGLGGIDVDDATTLDIDFTYMITNNFGLELLLDLTSKHDVKGAYGLPVQNVGDVTVLPPSLIAQWHFMPANNIRPYAGAGINYTFFFNESTTSELDTALGGSTGLSVDDEFGLVAQAGVDIDINKDWYVNFDAKYIALDTTATIQVDGVDTAKVNFDLNPWVFGVGIGTSF